MGFQRVGSAAAFFIIGAIMLCVAGALAFNTLTFLRHSVVAHGVVESLNAGGKHPQVAFTTARGERISYAQGGFVSGWRVGDAVDVRYLPDRPRDARMNRFGALWSGALFVLLFATIMLLAGASALS